MVKRLGLCCGVICLLLAAFGFLGPFPAKGGAGFPLRKAADLDGDGITEEYSLAGHCFTVREGEKELWQSPPDWRVDNFVLEDADNDGELDIVITLWKKGSYGSLKPFWLKGEDDAYKNHLFVYRLKNKAMKQVWCSSALDQPIISLRIRDWDGDGLNELVVREGQYRRIDGENYGLDTNARVRTSVWRWDEWGFSLLTAEE